MRNWTIIFTAAVLAVSCHSSDPAEEAARVNKETDSLISACDTTGTPMQRYQALMEIKASADSAMNSTGGNFRKKRYEKFCEAVVKISDNPDFQSAWNSMVRANRSELEKIPAGVWLVNADSVYVNTIFMLDRKRESIVPYNIKGSNALDFSSDDGLAYARPLVRPLFFFSNDTTGLYEISMPDGYYGRFRKAGMQDLAMGHFDCIEAYNLDYDGFEQLEVSNGHAEFGDSVYELTFGTENFFSKKLKKMIFKDFTILCLQEEHSRKGCYDCWGLFNGFRFSYRWSRKIQDEAANILYIFGEPEHEWTYSQTCRTATSEQQDGTSDWDDILDSYEVCVDKYISMVKKAADGDLSAISSYAEFARQAQEFSGKLAGADDVLTPEQQKRYIRILGKMTSAAGEMY